MNLPEKWTEVIGGKRYSVETASVVADNCYWDGHNFERHGRNTYLLKAPKGAFFLAHLTCWRGERDTLEPISVEEAKEYYDELPEKSMSYEEAFGEVPVEA